MRKVLIFFVLSSFFTSFCQMQKEVYSGRNWMFGGRCTYEFLENGKVLINLNDQELFKKKYELIGDSIVLSGKRKLKKSNLPYSFYQSNDSILIDLVLGYDFKKSSSDTTSYWSESGKNNYPYIPTGDVVFKKNVLNIIKNVFSDTSVADFIKTDTVVVKSFYQLDSMELNIDGLTIIFSNQNYDVSISKCYIHPLDQDKYFELVLEFPLYAGKVLKVASNYSIVGNQFVFDSKGAWIDYNNLPKIYDK